MKRITIIVVFLLFGMAIYALAATKTRGTIIPNVNYAAPENESIIDLGGRESLTFSWKPTPIPSGGRRAYKFTLFKGFGREVVFDKELDPQATSINIPVETFENDETYTWRVKQRATGGGGWSADLRWSFKIIR